MWELRKRALDIYMEKSIKLDAAIQGQRDNSGNGRQ